MLQKIKSQPIFSVCRVLSIVVFMVSIIFQMTVNTVFAGELSFSEKQFVTQVSGSGKPVILIPGLMSDGRVWGKLANVLSKTCQVHIINIAGFANTPAIGNPSLTAVKQHLLAYINTHKLYKSGVIGHSLGGFMSLWLCSSVSLDGASLDSALLDSAPSEIGPIISVDCLPFIGPVFTRTNASTVESLAE